MKPAICLITIIPNKTWLDFLNKFTNYDIFVVVDNLQFDYSQIKNDYPNVKIIIVTDEECKKYGYIHSSYMPYSSLVFNEIIAWDRALCYFTNLNKNYEQVWFFEDDVFFYNEETLLQIDTKYQKSDMLCKNKNPQPGPGEWCWFWPAITIHFSPPYFHSPICAVKLSNTFLSCLDEYIKVNKKLPFVEAILPSIAHQQNLNLVIASEFSEIHWRKDWKYDDFNTTNLFHPVKNMEQQEKTREYLIKKVKEN
jgi:hypothetical protein